MMICLEMLHYQASVFNVVELIFDYPKWIGSRKLLCMRWIEKVKFIDVGIMLLQEGEHSSSREKATIDIHFTFFMVYGGQFA